ncbi:MAG: guanylate kinase [Thermoanaerobaculia bacterium]|nr:guanylate kinase [Thermoanaerobaculia bacterium]
MAGDLFILSAPSGAGKTTIIRDLLDRELIDPATLSFSVSHTTRSPRPGEVDGVDYHFVDVPTFQRMIAGERFLEWAEVYGNYYGTSLEGVMPQLESGLDVLMDIDVKGAAAVLEKSPRAVGIFVMPPSYETLRSRLQGRNLDSPEAVERRLTVSLWEIRRYHLYEYVIINQDAGRASEALAAIILARRHCVPRVESRAAEISAGFERAFDLEHPVDEPIARSSQRGPDESDT